MLLSLPLAGLDGRLVVTLRLVPPPSASGSRSNVNLTAGWTVSLQGGIGRIAGLEAKRDPD